MRHILRMAGTALLVLLAALPALAQDDLAGTRWQLAQINGVDALLSAAVTLNFDTEETGLGGSGGCNSYSARYNRDGETLTVAPVISTSVICVDQGVVEQEAAYLAALGSAVSAVVEGERLVITASDGTQLVFDAIPTLPGTQWQLGSLGGAALVPGSVVTLEFSADGMVSGSAGCNRYTGSVTVNGALLTIGELVRTLMMCVDTAVAAQETAYLSALQSALDYTINHNQLTVNTVEGALVFMPLVSLAGTEWTLVSLGETPVIADSELTLAFSADGRMSGSGGCNRFMGGYTLSENRLTMTEIASTRRACLSDALSQQEMTYFAALGASRTFTLLDDQLAIVTADGRTLTFRQTVDLASSTWQIDTINGRAVVAGTAPTLQFDAQGGLGGNGSCNSFGGSYTVERDRLLVSEVFSTMMACEEAIMAQEMAYLAVLQSSPAFTIAGETLTLTGDAGVLVFTRQQPAP